MASGSRLSTSGTAVENPDMKLEEVIKCLIQSDVPSNVPDLELLRTLIASCWKSSPRLINIFRTQLLDLAVQLLEVLAVGSWPLEEQLLSSTALCAVLGSTLSQYDAVNVLLKCLQVLHGPVTLKVSLMWDRNSQLSIELPDKFQLGLCYGLLQCKVDHIVRSESGSVRVDLLKTVFDIFQKLCKQYSRLTIIAFRGLVKWLQIVNEVGLSLMHTSEIPKTIFAVVNNNWESPINGVRKENQKIFELLIDACDMDKESLFSVNNLLPTVLREQSWKMKSKYFMLAILLPRYGVVSALTQYPDIAACLVSSVHYTHLVSAGCDAYKACLKHIHQQPIWCRFFKEPIIQVLSADVEDDIGKQNLYNHWLKVTITSFPDLLPELITILVGSMEICSTAILLSVISLVHLGRKEGLIYDLWEQDWVSDHPKSWRRNLLDTALQHSNETIRNYAFSAVCISSKSLSFPSEDELYTIQTFLVQNANADSAPLRQGILNSFIRFLLRIRDSFLHEMKQTETQQSALLMTRILNFLDWLHSFCISNLKPGTNYQRKILSLCLFQEVLKYFDDDCNRIKWHGKRRKAASTQGVKVKQYAIKHNLWNFNSEASHACLLDCLRDSTNDIRETAGRILMDHFNKETVHVEDTEKLIKKALDLCSSTLFYETESGALMIKVAANMVHNTPQKTMSNVEVSHLVSRLTFNEPCVTKALRFDRLEISEKFRTFNFFEDKADISYDVFENDDIEEMMFCPAARKLLEGLKVFERKSRPTAKRFNKKLKYTPGTFEGLLIRDPEMMAKIGDTEPSLMAKTFEGMTVVDPITGEIGQHLNFPRPIKKTQEKHTDEEGNKISPSSHVHEELPRQEFRRKQYFPPVDVQDPLDRDEKSVKLWGNSEELPTFMDENLSKLREDVNKFFKGARDLNIPEKLSNSKQRKLKRNPKSVSLSLPSPQEVGTGSSEKKERPTSRRLRKQHRPFTKKKSSRRAPPWANLWNDVEISSKSTILQVPESKAFPVSPAPSLDWDTGGDLMTLQQVDDMEDPLQAEMPAVLNEQLGEEDWWEMPSPATVMGMLLYRAWAQWRTLCKDMFAAITCGSPLHGLLSAMTQLVGEDVPITTSECQEIIALLEDVVQHLLKVLASKANKSSAAPSFAEMSEAIENAIHRSHSTAEISNEQISPAHQLVLNCLWLNLKASCMLASELAKRRETPGELIPRCEQVIVQVLLRCRHKGAIEAAGSALASFVRNITSPEENRTLNTSDGRQMKVTHLPAQLLMQFLSSLHGNANKMSTTRRSAGLAILVHKIVANDMQPGKLLVEKCVSHLLALARSPVSCSTEQLKCDLPQAQALHFLCTLMQDSGLRQDMAPHVSDTALLCFENFSSSIWTIRNAALQLFGALVPKLVGEKKFQDDDSEGYGNITIEEFFSHYPDLVKYLLAALAKCEIQHTSTLAQHSSLVPVLSLLSKLSVGGYSLMEDALKQTIQNFNKHFINLLSSKIFAVRKTAAKAFARFVELPKIPDMVVTFVEVLSQEQPNENEAHGILLVLKYLKERLLSDCVNPLQSRVQLEENLKKLYEISFIDSVSWLNKALIAEVCGIGFITRKNIENVNPSVLLKQILYTLELYVSNSKLTTGIYHWALVEAEFIFKMCHERDMAELWHSSYHSNWDELPVKYLTILESRLHQLGIESKTALFDALLNVVVGIHWLKSFDLLYGIYKTLLLLVTKDSLGQNTDLVTVQTLHLKSNAKKEMGIQCWSIVLPLTCALLAAQEDTVIVSQIALLYQVTHNIVERTSAANFNESCRLDAAKSFSLMYRIVSRIFTPEFRSSRVMHETLLVAQDVGEMVLDAGIAFLQDEDSNVRREATKFIDNQLNPYTCLEKLLKPNSILNILSRQQAMAFLCTKLINLESCKKIMRDLFSTEAMASPFCHGTSNIYAEEINIVHLIGKNLLFLIRDADDQMKKDLDMLLPIPLIEEDLNIMLSYAYYGKKAGVINSTARAAFHVIDEKLNYLLKVKIALMGLNIDNLQHIIQVYQKHLQEL